MAERNVRKERSCKMCGYCVLGKASKLKAHGRECKKTHENAAAQAIMDKMKQDMASEDVLNAEGD